jgi:hypothetical protein
MARRHQALGHEIDDVQLQCSTYKLMIADLMQRKLHVEEEIERIFEDAFRPRRTLN